MKTPHRDKEGVLHFEVLNHIGETIECTAHYQQHHQHARWKRKNRITQLKRTIARCNGSHLPKWSPVHHAFCILKRMNHPDRKAPHSAWARYLDELELVRHHIHYAILKAHLAGYKALPPVHPPHPTK